MDELQQISGVSWKRLEQLIEQGDGEALESYWRSLPSGELARALSRLDDPMQGRLLALLDPDDAADMMDDLSVVQAADILEEVSPEHAAAIVDELNSDEQVDILKELDEDDAQAILAKMAPEEADDVRLLSQYDPQTAGGIMFREFLVYPQAATVEDVLADLRANVEEYAEYDAQYIFVNDDANGQFAGLVKVRYMVLRHGDTSLKQLIDREAGYINVNADLDKAEEFFDRYEYAAAAVVDEHHQIVGVVRRSHVQEAISNRSSKSLMRLGGIVTGEELRTMPVLIRSLRRLAYLIPIMGMMIVSINVIALFEPTIKELPALAIFLPLVAGLSGCAGNQAVAVSMRELALGLACPMDFFRVLSKEIFVGLAIGILLGLAIFGIVYAMRGHWELALVVAGVIPLTMTVAVAVGGAIPLAFKAINVDPAMASSPIVTTVVDLISYSSVLGVSTLVLPHLV